MNWIVKIENEKKKRIKISFNPLNEEINFFGEYLIKNKWEIFSHEIYDNIEITLEQIQMKMENVIVIMNKRTNEYDNLDKGFGVLKWIAFNEIEN